MITYKEMGYAPVRVQVFLDGKLVGTIYQVFDGIYPKWQYWPKCGGRGFESLWREGGEKFATLELCKASLEVK
jgi:hypothetical protein